MPLNSRRASRRWSIAFLSAIAVLFAAATNASATTVLAENFDNVANLVPNGWLIVNNSAPSGTTDWFQGNPAVFTAQSGGSDSYVAANFEAAGFGGNISDWLISPQLTFSNGDVINFWSRTEVDPASFPDSLELRLSLNGGSTNVGATDSSVGDFSTLLLTINAGLTSTGYPDGWTLFSATISGLGGPTNGRFAFRYDVPNTDVNGNYIGIDSVSVVATPEPSTMALLSIGLLAAARRRANAARRRSH